jgi:hypothetical protein
LKLRVAQANLIGGAAMGGSIRAERAPGVVDQQLVRRCSGRPKLLAANSNLSKDLRHASLHRRLDNRSKARTQIGSYDFGLNQSKTMNVIDS